MKTARLHALALVLVAVTVFAPVAGTAAFATPASAQPIEIDSCEVIDDPGTYELAEDIQADDGPCIEIRADDVTLDGQGHTVEVEQGIGLLVGTHESVTVRDIEVRGVNRGDDVAAVRVRGTRDLRIADSTFVTENQGGFALIVSVGDRASDFRLAQNVRITGLTAVGGSPAVTLHANDAVVEDSVVRDAKQAGLAVRQGDDVTIRGVRALRNGAGVVVGSAGEGTGAVRIENVVARNNIGAGIGVFGNDDGTVTIEDSVSTGNEFGLELSSATDVTVRNLRAANNDENGLEYERSSDVRVLDSAFVDNGENGVFVAGEANEGKLVLRRVRAEDNVNREVEANGPIEATRLYVSEETTVSVHGGPVSLQTVGDEPDPPSGLADIEQFVLVDSQSPSTQIAFNYTTHREVIAQRRINPDTLSIYRQDPDGGDWTEIDDVSVNTEKEFVMGTTGTGEEVVLAPFGEQSDRLRQNGGDEIVESTDDGPDWATADDSPFLDGGSSASTDDEIDYDDSVPEDTPEALFQSEWYGEMDWSFPAEDGATYEVRLYFAEIDDEVDQPGERVFDVRVEGNPQISAIEIVEVGED